MLYLLNLRGQQTISLVEIVASLAEDAGTITIVDITPVNCQVGPDAGISNQVEPSIAGRTHSIPSYRFAITGAVLTCPVPECEPRSAGRAGGAGVGVTVDCPHADVVPEQCAEAAGDTLAIIGGIVGEAGAVILEALAVGDGEGGLAGEALIGRPVKIALGNGVAIHTGTQHAELETFSAGKTDSSSGVAIVAIRRTGQRETEQ